MSTPIGRRAHKKGPISRALLAGVPGLEPRTKESESSVLPITPYPNGSNRNPNRLTTLPYRSGWGEPGLVWASTSSAGLDELDPRIPVAELVEAGRLGSTAVGRRDADQVSVDGGGDATPGARRDDELLRPGRRDVAGSVDSGVTGSAVPVDGQQSPTIGSQGERLGELQLRMPARPHEPARHGHDFSVDQPHTGDAFAVSLDIRYAPPFHSDPTLSQQRLLTASDRIRRIGEHGEVIAPLGDQQGTPRDIRCLADQRDRPVAVLIAVTGHATEQPHSVEGADAGKRWQLLLEPRRQQNCLRHDRAVRLAVDALRPNLEQARRSGRVRSEERRV